MEKAMTVVESKQPVKHKVSVDTTKKGVGGKKRKPKKKTTKKRKAPPGKKTGKKRKRAKDDVGPQPKKKKKTTKKKAKRNPIFLSQKHFKDFLKAFPDGPKKFCSQPDSRAFLQNEIDNQITHKLLKIISIDAEDNERKVGLKEALTLNGIIEYVK